MEAQWLFPVRGLKPEPSKLPSCAAVEDSVQAIGVQPGQEQRFGHDGVPEIPKVK
jgi:hypothetical protein